MDGKESSTAAQGTPDSPAGDRPDTGKEQDAGRQHVIFVDGTGEDSKQVYNESVVEAAEIIERAGYREEPEDYILEALRGQSGAVEEEFDPQGEAGPVEVDLSDQSRKHFRVRTRGEVFI